MNEIYKRIINLVALLGLDTTAGSENAAVLKGYAAGLEMIMSDMQLLEKNLMPETSTGVAFELFCNMFRVDNDMSEAEKRQKIIERFKERFGDYVKDGITKAFADYGIACSIHGRMILVTGSISDDIGIINKYSKVLSDYQSPSSYVTINGTGFTFDYWDATVFTFNNYDNLNLPFCILDELK